MEKKDKNERFLKAIDLLYQKQLVNSQKQLAEKIGIGEAALSRIKNGSKIVSDETIRKMNAAFNNMFNMDYFRGVEGTELINAPIASQPETKAAPEPIDQSSLVNALLAAKDETIASLKRQIEQQSEMIELLRKQYDDIRYAADRPTRRYDTPEEKLPVANEG